jgi:hypothetical protein
MHRGHTDASHNTQGLNDNAVPIWAGLSIKRVHNSRIKVNKKK